MLIYNNEYQTKENQNSTKDKLNYNIYVVVNFFNFFNFFGYGNIC